MYPDHFRYTKEHEWVSVEGDIGTIGITDHAQQELGDIVYVDLPKIGARVSQGRHNRIGRIRQSRIRHLFSGIGRGRRSQRGCWRISPEKLNEDPHGEAWLVKIRLTSPDEIKGLLSAADYRTYIGE